MGIDLTKQLFARHAAHLTAGELVVLGYMCLVALDKENGKGQPPGLYFGGWEPLAIALGHHELDDNAKQKVKRAVKGIRDKGLVKPLVKHAQTGMRQVYAIQLGKAGVQDQTPYRGTGSDPQEGVIFGQDRGADPDPPRTYIGQTEDLPQDITPSSSTQPKTARGDEKQEGVGGHKFEGTPSDECLTCGGAYLNRKAHPLHLLRIAR